ncbi:MAG: glycosyl transferase [Sulfurovum sp.]|nr:MAG: glycosyl transferase [Sulfurovum sp.]
MTSQLLKKLDTYSSLLIVGPYPPPLGGVSVHIYRLHQALSKSNIFNISRAQSYKGENYIRLFKDIVNHKYEAIHIHDYDIKLIILLSILRKVKKFDLIATSHNPRLFEEESKIKKLIYKKFLESLNTFVAVGKHILVIYKENGVTLPHSTIVEPAFIAPPLNEERKILKTYPSTVFDFLNTHSPILTANAFQIVFHKAIDLYGLDLCIELVSKLKKNFPNIGFIFALANESVNVDYLEKIKTRTKELDIEENFFFLTGQKELWPLFKKVDLMVRPTSSDGYGISIAEALYFGCSAIASDISDRPEGTILFNNRDINDLYVKSKEVLYAEKPN